MRRPRVVKASAAVALTLALAACGSSGARPEPLPCGLSAAPGGAQLPACVPPDLGVTVTGLAGTGLVVHSSLGDDLPVAVDGSYPFPTRPAAGAAYTLTVTGQPVSPWQTCALGAGATGTFGDAAVRVAVTCTTHRYRVGGAATGVLGGGLTLRCGGDTLVLDADGAFTFATSIASGDPYAVTTLAVPATETCALTGGAGTIAGVDVNTVTVTCGCAGGRADCDGDPANGCEVDTTSDAAHCGGCAGACSFANATPACSGGTCALLSCAPGFGDCDLLPGNGCETYVGAGACPP